MERRMSPFFYGENEEILTAAFSDVRKGYGEKNEHVVRSSLLDDLFENTTLRKSLFLGIYRLLIIVIGMHVINFFLVRIVNDITLLDTRLFYQAKENVVPLLIVTCIYIAYSFIALILQKIVAATNMNMTIAKVLAHSCQYAILLIPLWIRYNLQ